VALRVAAIDFLNPAPLMWDFHHPPLQAVLAKRYALHLTEPAQCARELLEGRADLGLIPIAALTPELRIVPGCAIASLGKVRSIQLIVKAPLTLAEVKTVAADTASRSSVAYAEILFRHFLGVAPEFRPHRADAEAMLAEGDAALLIGDPALLALERRDEIEATVGLCVWHDVAELWRERTGLPWVAAVWAVRPEAVPEVEDRRRLIADLNGSRDRGIAHIDDLVQEWGPKIALPAATIRHYLERNIHYVLDDECVRSMGVFRELAARVGVLDGLAELPFLEI
jgi:chorismate dehydratase